MIALAGRADQPCPGGEHRALAVEGVLLGVLRDGEPVGFWVATPSRPVGVRDAPHPLAHLHELHARGGPALRRWSPRPCKARIESTVVQALHLHPGSHRVTMAEQLPTAGPEHRRRTPSRLVGQRRRPVTLTDVAHAQARARLAAENAAWAFKELEHARRHGSLHEVRAAKQVERAARHEARVARAQARVAHPAGRVGPDPASAAPEDRHRDAPFFALYVAFVVVAGTLMVMLAMGVA